MYVALLIEYNGGFAAGWQQQPGLVTVESEIIKAIKTCTGQVVDYIDCAGRTDKGVHAVGQIIGFQTHITRESVKWLTGLNHFLPPWIRVIRSWTLLDESFHPRFGAIARTYRYYLKKSKVHYPLFSGAVTPYFGELDDRILVELANYIVGTHNFSAFRSGSCQAHSPIKTCYQARWERKGAFLVFEITANAFLHHMVRYLVGTQLRVAKGEKSITWFKDLLENRTKQDDCAPPEGLYLCQVRYQENSPVQGEFRYPWFDDNSF